MKINSIFKTHVQASSNILLQTAEITVKNKQLDKEVKIKALVTLRRQDGI